MSNLVDQYLLYRVRTKRDAEAFGRIYDSYIESLYRFILLKVPSEQDAQDIAAETFTRAWQFMLGKAEVTHIRALLYRIARNLIADFYRQQRPTVALNELVVTFDRDFPSTSSEGDLHDQGANAHVMEMRAEFALALEKLAKLKDDYRDVLSLRLIDDLAFSDIARILETSVGNARVIYHRALKALQDLH